MELKGLKKAVGEYQKANEGGRFSPWYGRLMMDLHDGEIWTDTFYDLGHNEYTVYHRNTIINLGSLMAARGIGVTMKNVKEFLEDNYDKMYDKGADTLKDDYDWY